jgi:membrane protein CcdC involved in cytochrome C biogenesis
MRSLSSQSRKRRVTKENVVWPQMLLQSNYLYGLLPYSIYVWVLLMTKLVSCLCLSCCFSWLFILSSLWVFPEVWLRDSFVFRSKLFTHLLESFVWYYAVVENGFVHD